MADICVYVAVLNPHGMGNERKRGRLRAARDGKEVCYEPLLTVVQDFLLPCLRCKKAALKCHWFFCRQSFSRKGKKSMASGAFVWLHCFCARTLEL